jgi:hypothetical protein
MSSKGGRHVRSKNQGTARRSRDLEGRLLAFLGGLLLDATAHLASGAVACVLHRRRVRRRGELR